ncbi:MAG: glycosyltransferase family 4 protein [Ruminococcus sp.]|jgi:glycosyltransferase involved in cell wall biosynthesis|nr:glycosyltransferase family 4 protein [Ruminococcus sp.]
MKKIVIVTKNLFGGGAERVIAQLSNYFVSRDAECVIITTDDREIGYKLDERIVIKPIGKKSNNSLVDRIKRLKQVRKIVKTENPDIVLTMPEDTGVYIILALLGTKYPVYISERNNPWVMPDSKVTRALRKMMYPFVKGIVFQTEMAKSFFSEKIQKKGVVLPNPVDSSRIPERFTGEREKTVAAASRLYKQKNFPMLIKAFADFSRDYPEYNMVIYGEGPEREMLEQMIADLQLGGKVELPGREDNVLELMNSKAMFVLSSDYEGMPNSLIEAMCMGMPVISTDCPSGGPKQLIENKKNGILVDVGSDAQLADAMRYMAADNNAETLSDEAYKIRGKLTSKQVFDDWYDYLFSEK